MDFDALADILRERSNVLSEIAERRTQAESHAKNVKRLEDEIVERDRRVTALEAKARRLLTPKPTYADRADINESA